ncbi:MAG: DNA polymerase III subunit delta [Coriobacteriia bacterium]|nr:DNA polymerase III subunit delta [Coriobacteriia bacterium]MCL2536971.1 DNA polymerase III subunit delta [Coriobacteriia bacterium]
MSTATASKPKLQPVNIIISEQDLLRAEALKLLRKRMEDDGVDLSFDMTVLDADSMDVAEFYGSVGTIPFMSPLRLVIVNNIDKLTVADERTQAVLNYCSNPNPTTVLALTAHKLAKTTKLYKAIAQVGHIIDRKAPTKRDLPERVILMFAKAGIHVSLREADVLINLVGDDLASINSAIEQLAAYKNVAQRRMNGDDTLVLITVQEISELIGETSEVKAWELTDALATRNGEKVMDILSRLTRTEGEKIDHFVVFLAAGKIRELLTARVLASRGTASKEALMAEMKSQSKTGRAPQPWLAERIIRQSRNFSVVELREGLRELAAVEDTLKTSPPALGRLALVRCLLALC